MSVVSRVLVAGLVCASLVGVQVARAASPGESSGDTKGRLLHASKCVLSLGFSGGCDKDAPEAKSDGQASSKPIDPAVASKVVEYSTTRARLLHASKCVVSFGFSGGCDKDAPEGSAAAAGARAEAAPKAPAAPDTSTRGRFFHASKCVATLGFGGGCDKGDEH